MNHINPCDMTYDIVTQLSDYVYMHILNVIVELTKADYKNTLNLTALYTYNTIKLTIHVCIGAVPIGWMNSQT